MSIPNLPVLQKWYILAGKGRNPDGPGARCRSSGGAPEVLGAWNLDKGPNRPSRIALSALVGGAEGRMYRGLLLFVEDYFRQACDCVGLVLLVRVCVEIVYSQATMSSHVHNCRAWYMVRLTHTNE